MVINRVFACGVVFGALTVTAVHAQPKSGSIVGWGSQVIQGDLSEGFVQVSAGWNHSLGLRADGSVVAWGDNYYGQCRIPEPNAGFVAVSGGARNSLALKDDGSVVGWGYRGSIDPEPNSLLKKAPFSCGTEECPARLRTD